MNIQLPARGSIAAEPRFVRALAGWIAFAARHARMVTGAAIAVSVAAAFYAAGHLGMETDSNALLSPDLPHRKTQASFDKAFPQLGDNIVVVIDGDTPAEADAAGAALAGRLRAQPELFRHIFYPEGDPFFRRNGLLFQSVDDLQALSDRLADVQPLLGTLAKDMTLRGLFDLLTQAADGVADGDTDPAQLVRPFQRIAEVVDAPPGAPSARLDWSDLMQPKASDPADRRRFILAQPIPDYSGLSLADDAIAAIRAAIAGLDRTQADSVRVRLTGGIPLRADELRSVGDGVGLASLLSFLIVAGLVYIGLRSWRLMAAILVALVIGLTWTAGFAALAIGHLNLLSVAFAVMFIGIAVDFGIQVGLRYQEQAANGNDNLDALRQAAPTGAAVCLAALCAAIGFLAFVPTAYVGLAELGIISGAGMAIGAFCALTVLPALLNLGPLREKTGRSQRVDVPLTAPSYFVTRHGRAICLGSLALGLAALAALPAVRFDFDPIALDDPKAESVQTYVDLAANGGTSPYAINVVAPDIAAAVALAHRLDALAVVDRTITVQSFIPERQDEKLPILADTALFMRPVLDPGPAAAAPSVDDTRAAAGRMLIALQRMIGASLAPPLAAAATRLTAGVERMLAQSGFEARIAGLEQALLAGLPRQLDDLRLAMGAGPAAMADVPEDVRARYVAADGRARVEVFPKEDLTDRAALRRFVHAVQQVAPDATDTPVLLLQGGDAIVDAFFKAGFLALAAISVLLLVVLRSLVAALQVLLPLLLALVLTVAIMAVAGMSFNFANIIALPLLLTLGVAFGIYLVLRYREAGDVDRLLATSSPRAVLFSALTTMVSFGSLMVSSHRGTASMGLLLTICLTLAVTCTLAVLPALLAWRQQRRRAAAPGAIAGAGRPPSAVGGGTAGPMRSP
ncbi:MAG: MMPL family transporter [Alphaproteobacteria bacterium]|nr:MMPL family transporter [Alphaproteobacteria bacterium]